MASDEGDLRIVFSWAMQDGDSGWAAPDLSPLMILELV